MVGWKFDTPNPIVAYTVGIEFDRAIDDASLRRVMALHSQLRRELPRKVEQQSFTVNFGFQPPQSVAPNLGGVVFDSLKPDGSVLHSLTITRNSCSYMTSNYTRWAEYWPVAERLIGSVCKEIEEMTNISAFVLVGNNKFHWTRSQAPDLGQLLKSESIYIAQNLLLRQSACHSFHGYQTILEGDSAEQIDNINVVLGNDPMLGWASELTFHHRRTLRLPVSCTIAMQATGDGSRSMAARILDEMHSLNNTLAKATLSDEILADIPGLGSP